MTWFLTLFIATITMSNLTSGDTVYKVNKECSAGKLEYSSLHCEIFIRGFVSKYGNTNDLEIKLRSVFGVKFSIIVYERNDKIVPDFNKYFTEYIGRLGKIKNSNYCIFGGIIRWS